MSSEKTTQHAESEAMSQPEPTKLLTDQTNYLPRRQIIQIFLSCAAVGTVGLLDDTMLAVALPVISSEMNAGTNISWLAGAYFVASTACQLLYGRLSDIWSRKTTLYALIFVFFIGNLACSVSSSFIQLLIFRAITGIGGGGMPTVAQVIVSDVVSLRERGKYQGILGVSVAIAYGVGPLIGGAFAQYSSWRWIFRLTLPLTALSAACVWLFMPLKPTEGNWKEKLARVDFIGALFILGASTLVMLSLNWAGSEHPWASSYVLATLIVGIALAVAFVLWEWKGPRVPLLPLHIFKNRIVVGAAITQTINGWLTIVQVFFLPTFYQTTYGYSAVKSGALLLPLTVVQTLASTGSGLIVSWTGRYRELILVGWALWAVGLGLMTTLDVDSSLAKQIGYSILTGVGIGGTLQPSLVALQGAMGREDMAVVTAMRSFARNLGGTIGLAVTGSIVNNILSSHLSHLDLPPALLNALKDNPVAMRPTLSPELLAELIAAYRKGFRVVFGLLAGLAVLSFFVAATLMTHLDLRRADDEKLKQEGKEFMTKLGEKEKTSPALPEAAPIGDLQEKKSVEGVDGV